MPTINLDEIIARQLADPAVRSAMLNELASQLVSGDFETGFDLLCRMVNEHNERIASTSRRSSAHVDAIAIPDQAGTARELLSILGCLQRAQKSTIELRLVEQEKIDMAELPEPLHSAAA